MTKISYVCGMAIPDFTGAQIAILNQLAQDKASGNFPTAQEVRDMISLAGGSTKSIPNFQAVTIAGGIASIERLAQVSYVAIATEGGASTDQLDTLTAVGPSAFNRGDSVVIYMGQTGRTITTSATGNIQAQGFTWQDESHFICFQYTGTVFVEAYRFPAATGTTTRQLSECLITSGGVAAITCPTAWAYTRYLDPGTETRATADYTVTGAAGANGTYRVIVDNQSGVTVTIAETAYTAATTVNAEATAIEVAINAGTVTHGYTALAVGAVVTITAPVGTGAAANAYTLGSEVTGGATATTTGFASGVDATEAASDLDYIYPEVAGKEILVTNGMAAAAITLTAIGNIASSAAGALAAQTSIRLIFNPLTSEWIPA